MLAAILVHAEATIEENGARKPQNMQILPIRNQEFKTATACFDVSCSQDEA
jgi:hypothetical protein